MADQAWLKNLAGAKLVAGQWQHDDPEAVRGLVAARLDDAVQALHEEALEACELYNQHARAPRQIRVLRATPQPGKSRGGLMLLLGRCQLNLELKDDPKGGVPALEVSLATVKGFERIARRTRRFLPHVDPFGTVAWREDNALLMTNELIMKRMFEDIARAHFETEAP